MAVDGILLHSIFQNMLPFFPAKILKIHQINQDTLLFTINTQQKQQKLLISLHSDFNRIQFTNQKYESQQNPKSFLMLLRKKIDHGVITTFQQIDLDRIIHFQILVKDDSRDSTILHLYCELMGKYANVILTDKEGIILDAFKRLPPNESNRRTIHPGAMYRLPSPQANKQNPFSHPVLDLQNPIINQISGCSPLLAKEIIYRLQQKEDFEKIAFQLQESSSLYIYDTTMHIIELKHLSTPYKKYPLMEGLDTMYQNLEMRILMQQQNKDLHRIIQRELQKNERKLLKLKTSLENACNCEKYRIFGDLLFANIHKISRQETIQLQTFEDQTPVTIPLDIRYDIKGNANRYYHKYHKEKRAQKFIKDQLVNCQSEIEYFKDLQLHLQFATSRDAQEIRAELIKYGLLKQTTKRKQQTKQKELPHYDELCIDGIQIYVGKNNLQNEYVTWKLAKKQDTWFHVKDLHGSHIIVCADKLNEKFIRIGALLAAYYSQGKLSSSVPVNYCHVSQLKKIPGNRGSFVSLSNYKTIYIDPLESSIVAIYTQSSTNTSHSKEI